MKAPNPGAGWSALSLRRAAVAFLVALLPAAASAAGESALTQQAAAGDVATPSAVGAPSAGTLTGNYLAGRHAQARRELGTAIDYLKAALAQDPGNRDLLRRMFLLTAMTGRIDDAIPMARRVVTGDGDAPIANIMLVIADVRAGKFKDAERRLAKMPDTGLNAFMRPLLLAWTLVGDKRPEEGLEALKPLTKNSGYQGIYELHTALINERMGRLEAAETHFDNAAKGGLSLRLVEFLGALYQRTGRPDKAFELYNRYQSEHPSSQLLDASLVRLQSGAAKTRLVASAADGIAEALFGVASSLRTQNARETALVFGHLALYLKPDFPLTQILMADILESEDQLAHANALYDAISPKSSFAWSARLRIASNLDRLDRPDEAVSQLEKLAKEDAKNPEPFINIGDIMRRRDRFTEAVEAYDTAAARIGTLERRHWSLLYARGIALERSKQWKRAEADFLKALEFEPDQPYVLNYLGYSWVDQGLNLERAREMIEKAVKLRPNDGYIIDSLGWALYRMSDYQGAARELERAVELRPEDPVINDHLGDAYWQVGRRAEARFQWKRALSLKPEPDIVPTITAKLKRGLEKAEVSTGDR